MILQYSVFNHFNKIYKIIKKSLLVSTSPVKYFNSNPSSGRISCKHVPQCTIRKAKCPHPMQPNRLPSLYSPDHILILPDDPSRSTYEDFVKMKNIKVKIVIRGPSITLIMRCSIIPTQVHEEVLLALQWKHALIIQTQASSSAFQETSFVSTREKVSVTVT